MWKITTPTVPPPPLHASPLCAAIFLNHHHWFRCSDHAMMFDYLFSSPSLVGRHLSIVSLKGLRCRP